jgi:glycosyltransferase involved in cell wall biosynthesis
MKKKIGFIKNGDGIEQFNLLSSIWRDNSVELIWDINKLRGSYDIVLISIVDNGRKKQKDDEHIKMFNIGIDKRNVFSKALSWLQYLYLIRRIIKSEKLNYIVISNFKFLRTVLHFTKKYHCVPILNFSRNEQLNKSVKKIISDFEIENIISPGSLVSNSFAGNHVKIFNRIPYYPESFFVDKIVPFWPNHKFIALFVGRLIRPKGIFEFLEAAKALSEKMSDMAFVITGDGPENEKIIKFISSNNLHKSVFIINNVPNTDIGNYMRKSSVLVSPSYTEGFSKTWVEAIYTHTPIILTDVSCTRSLFSDGIHGYFINLFDSNDIAEKILTLYNNNNLRTQMKRNLYELEQSDFFKNSQSTFEILKKVINSEL